MPQAPQFRDTRVTSDDPAMDVLRNDVAHLTRQLTRRAATVNLGVKTIGTTETPVKHLQSGPPRWAAHSVAGLAMIGQTRAPDANNLYLVASTEVQAEIEVW